MQKSGERIKINERVLVENINSIYDISLSKMINNKTVNGDIINYEAQIGLDILFEADNRSGLNFQRVEIPFVFKSNMEIEITDLNIESKSFSVNNEYVNCNIEIGIKKQTNTMKKISIIDNIESRECPEENEYKMIVYFVKKGDTIWNVSKKFKVCMDNIIKLNNLENPDKLNVGDRLYIMK